MKNFLVIVFFIISFSAFSQVSFTGYLLDVDEKKIKDVEVNLYSGNDKISTKKWSKSFQYDLELEKYYTLELVKEGFVAKRIAISTFEGDKGAEPFLFVMEMIKRNDQNHLADEDYPSALIEYKKDKGTFNFDLKYAKNLKREEKEAKKKKSN